MPTTTYKRTGLYSPSIEADPDSKLDYTFNWSDWLAAVSDTIATKTIVVDGVVLHSSSIIDGETEEGVNVTNSRVIVWLQNPTAPRSSCTCRITTVGGRVDDRTIYLLVRER